MQTTTTDVHWTALAACAGEDVALFMAPNGREHVDRRRVREASARSICSQCAVRADCLSYALRVNEPLGIWGGLNAAERRARRDDPAA